MNCYTVLIGHEGALRGHVVQREPGPRTEALVRAGFLDPLGAEDVVVPEVSGTFGLEDKPAKVVKRRGKQAKAGQGDGEVAQSPVGVEVRDEGDGSHGGGGEG